MGIVFEIHSCSEHTNYLILRKNFSGISEMGRQLIVGNAMFKSQEGTRLTESHGRLILRAFFLKTPYI